MRPNRLLLVPLVALVVGCASASPEPARFTAATADHRMVAILPFEVIFTGKMPKRLDAEEILAIEETESLAFQTAFYDRLVKQTNPRKKRPIRVAIQPIGETNRLLDAAGIGLRESWEMPTEALASTLGVDAVVRTSVHKNRYLSGKASFGLELALDLLYEATSDEGAWLPPTDLTKTHDVWTDCAVLAGDGEPLWEAGFEGETDWTESPNELIRGITKHLAKTFPYRS